MELNNLSRIAIGAAIEAHKELGGPGLLEDLYEEAFCHEMSLRGIRVDRQIPVPVVYKGKQLKKPLYLDVLVERRLIVEAKATEKRNPLYAAQLLTYLRLTGLRLGLVINFGEKVLRDGVERVINGYSNDVSL